MLGSLLHPHIWTNNLLFIGLVNGLTYALVAMGIVLVYRSSRIINFAVGDLGGPATALLGLYVAKSHWPYFPALIFALTSFTATNGPVGVGKIFVNPVSSSGTRTGFLIPLRRRVPRIPAAWPPRRIRPGAAPSTRSVSR